MGETKVRRTMAAAVLAALVAMGMTLTGCVPQPRQSTGERQADAHQSPAGKPYRDDVEGEIDPSAYNMKKPVLYLYPGAAVDVSVGIADPSRITTSYPEYGDGWHVRASPDGTLVDCETSRSLYALYYEGQLNSPEELGDEGFVVSHDDLIPFLEEKLAALGLTEREAEEMIVYWLPRMQGHDACYVRFSLTDEEQRQNALEIEPAPDHLIRVRMVWQGLDAGEAKEVAGRICEQHIEPVDRDSLDGFVAVEWGGTEIGSQRNS